MGIHTVPLAQQRLAGVFEHVVLDMELWAMLSSQLQHLLLDWLSKLAENLHHKCNLVRFKQVTLRAQLHVT